MIKYVLIFLLITSCAPSNYVLEPTGKLILIDEEQICFEFKVKHSKWKKYECFDRNDFERFGFRFIK
jgi:hypothetical protein